MKTTSPLPLSAPACMGSSFPLGRATEREKRKRKKFASFFSLFLSASAAAVSGSGRRIMRLRRTGVPA